MAMSKIGKTAMVCMRETGDRPRGDKAKKRYKI